MGQIIDSNSEQKIIERLRGLPPQKLDEIIQFIDFLVERNQNDTTSLGEEKAKSSILALRGRGRGEHLVERLLQSRREDKKQDDRK